MEKRIFEGIKVLDFTTAGAGPISINYLTFYGATMIKVEAREHVDTGRTFPLYKDSIAGLERSAYYAFNQMGKRFNITLNLSKPKGVELAQKLVAWADVVAENFSGGKMEKWGLAYEDIKKIKPDIIMLRSCVHGQTGPWSTRTGLGSTVTSLSGFNCLVGWPDRDPCGFGGEPIVDYASPLINAACVISALDYRRRTGKGQCLDISQHEANLHFIAPLILDYVVNHREPCVYGNQSPYAAPHGVYRCQGEDRWCAIAIFTDNEWENFCRVIGNPPWTKDSRFATLHSRIKHADELDKLIEQWTVKSTAKEVMSLLQAAGVAAGIVETMEDLHQDPQLKHYHCFEELEHPEMGKCSLYHGPGFRLPEADYELARPRLLGEHNVHVFTKILGISDAEFAKMVEDGVV